MTSEVGRDFVYNHLWEEKTELHIRIQTDTVL